VDTRQEGEGTTSRNAGSSVAEPSIPLPIKKGFGQLEMEQLRTYSEYVPIKIPEETQEELESRKALTALLVNASEQPKRPTIWLICSPQMTRLMLKSPTDIRNPTASTTTCEKLRSWGRSTRTAKRQQ
jgi:hypothetical protein